MLYVTMLVAAIGVVAYYLLRRSKKKVSPLDVYVCDVCGKKDCICHKVEPEK